MKVEVLPEPELEFGGGQRHVDIRFGLMNYGPLDFDSTMAPKQIRLGIVGTSETIEGLLTWLDRIKAGIASKPSKRPNLFPRFPGFGPETHLPAEVILDSRLHRTILQGHIDTLCRGPRTNQGVIEAVQLYMEELEYLAQKTPADVLVCALPLRLVEYIDKGGDLASLAEPEEERQNVEAARIVFHDLLKAQAMRLRKPTQVIRPGTYDETKRLMQKGRPGLPRGLQDEATRAWNFYTALYYKAGGIPWRLVRDSRELSVCYVGVGFFQSLDKSRLLTSVAQVFNELGEGVILRGGIAKKLAKDDRQIHLSREDAYNLLVSALEVYRREHKTFPARVAVHKTSIHNDDENSGFREALKFLRIDQGDFISVTDSMTRLFRAAAYPPLRGTFFDTDGGRYVLYTKGSVDFFSAYPGLYVPRPFAFRCDAVVETPRFLARECLGLTKMNWNNTQFDGGEPITAVAARQVGHILKYMKEDEPIEPFYRFYM